MTGARSGIGLVLMYHRVGAPGRDPWGLCVTPERFAEQLEVLATQLRPVRLLEALNARDAARPIVAVTFDDGYADNLLAARPLLERFDVPATVFVTTAGLGAEYEFWWDELEQLLAAPAVLPSELRLTIAGQEFARINDGAQPGEWAAGDGWRVFESPPPTWRQTLYQELWQRLQPLDADDQQDVLRRLCEWTGETRQLRPAYRTMSREELARLANGGLVDIGAHTVTHPVLPRLTSQRQHDEMQESRLQLRDALQRDIVTFSYPYGQHADETVAIARRIGFSCACSTTPAVLTGDPDPFRIPRFQVGDWGGETFERQLQSWLTLN